MRTLLLATGIAAAAQIGMAVAEEADAKKTEAPAEKAMEKKEAGEAKEEGKKPDVEVTIEGADNLQFNKKEFKVKEGQVVALTLKNVGNIPKAGGGHNIVILKSGTDISTFASDCIGNMQTTGLPVTPALQKQVLASTKILGPGEEDVVTFTAPAPGTYDYICSFPGHFGAMKGVMTVEGK